MSQHESHASSRDRLALLVDYDNALPDARTTAAVGVGLRHVMREALKDRTDVTYLELRLYGGWLDDGVLTRRASELAGALEDLRLLPATHPFSERVLRGDAVLVTELRAERRVRWEHTVRTRSGLPTVRLAQKPYPGNCVHESPACPVLALQRFARRPTRRCHAEGCPVSNREAFAVREQKLVDVLIACDAISCALDRTPAVVVSSDLDVLPALAMANVYQPAAVTLLRPAARAATLYDVHLRELGVGIKALEAA